AERADTGQRAVGVAEPQGGGVAVLDVGVARRTRCVGRVLRAPVEAGQERVVLLATGSVADADLSPAGEARRDATDLAGSRGPDESQAAVLDDRDRADQQRQHGEGDHQWPQQLPGTTDARL